MGTICIVLLDHRSFPVFQDGIVGLLVECLEAFSINFKGGKCYLARFRKCAVGHDIVTPINFKSGQCPSREGEGESDDTGCELHTITDVSDIDKQIKQVFYGDESE